MQRISKPEKLSGLHGFTEKLPLTYSVNRFIRSSVHLLFRGFPSRRSSPAYMAKTFLPFPRFMKLSSVATYIAKSIAKPVPRQINLAKV